MWYLSVRSGPSALGRVASVHGGVTPGDVLVCGVGVAPVAGAHRRLQPRCGAAAAAATAAAAAAPGRGVLRGGAPVRVQRRRGPAPVPAAPPPPQRGAPLRHVGQQLRQDPPQDAVVRRPRSPLASLRLDVLVYVPQGGVQSFVDGLFGLGSPPAAAVAAAAASPGARRGALFPAERHWADQEGQLGHRLLGRRDLGLGMDAAAAAAAAARLREPLRLLARSLPLVAKHGSEARVGRRAAALAGADEVAVLVALTLAQTLGTGLLLVVMLVVLVVTEVSVEGGGAVQALGGGQRAAVEVALAAEGGSLRRHEVAEVGRHGVLFAVGVIRVGVRPAGDGRGGEGAPAARLRPGAGLTLGRAASKDSMEKRRFGKLGVAPPPLLGRDDESPGVVAPDGASASPRLGMDLDFWMRCS
ncbi:hypothetical protein EYF80_000311 [Liparis tanakae]|uniref:Uncharacterized protein n=1 Tax=Liparis tanakae TaxID=230148 RepID=A0A4Z2JJ91_9TELE|nr:hypothetical protein EYF80_000311 [Liparis tanakae]